ncbi:MAG: hypothetical protein WC197_09075 [Candidatus Gastranaerophilaceae bacterium]|jgi:hypothetical protein
MTVEGFKPAEFSKDLVRQAREMIPAEFDKDKKQFIANTIYNYCFLAGDALVKDPNMDFNADQASIICQFIGEWTFHKSIDIMKSDIPSEHWEAILQKMAFIVFDAAKHSQLKKMDNIKAVEYVEYQITTAYEKLIKEMIDNGSINRPAEEILSHSNIDEIANEQTNNINRSKEQEEKELKIASLALFLRNLPNEKVNELIQSLSKEDQEKIFLCMSMKDLEKRVDSNIVNKYLHNFNDFLPGIKDKNSRKNTYSALNLTLKKISEKKLDTIFKDERINIKNFIYKLRNGKINLNGSDGFSPEIVTVINNYLLSKSDLDLNK